MPNPWIILAAIIALGGSWTLGNWHGHRTEATTWKARIEKERADAVTAALNIERKQQKAVNDALQKQNVDLRTINDRLAGDVERLRQRPERPARMPEAADTRCQGASGAELSRSDAQFLARLAARADRLRAALIACYAYADSIAPADAE